GNTSATHAVPNDGDGILIHNGGSRTAVGGINPDVRNHLAGNPGYGIRVENASLTTLQGNFIGANVTGSGARANGLGGVALLGTSHDNLIGGDHTTEAINLISGNTGAGVLIGGSAMHNVIGGNFIGTDATTGLAVP